MVGLIIHTSDSLLKAYADQASPFLEFSSVDDELLVSQFLFQQHISSRTGLVADHREINPADSKEGTRINNMKKKSNVSTVKQPRRTGKKDRHSKIHTAKGPRDRRMRLSLQIARKFFDLQDTLGFDKASKTIEWLLSKSKSAIKEVTDNFSRVKRSNSLGGNFVGSAPECAVSGMKLIPQAEGKRSVVLAEASPYVRKIPTEKKRKKSQKTALNLLARESRDKARARARERTREKTKIKVLEKAEQANPNFLNQKEPITSLENNKNLSSVNQETNSKVEVEVPSTYFLQHQKDSVTISNKFLRVTRVPRSYSINDFTPTVAVPSDPNLEKEITGFPVNWDISNARGNVNLQNPNIPFTGSSLFAQEQNLTSALMAALTSQDHYSDSVSLLNTDQQNPIPVPIPSSSNSSGFHPHFIDNQWPPFPIPVNYGSLFS
ncbi:hypothetical protein K2173_016993 [Erythroxylum novogranatense]|uniref:Uncharacterized protein n=1 Tax=Erythroxylum novogranatense TaxID=1862640 RepID=A0AAV8U5E5_9ROSI|nr:hypothetical protein K2173_016993 [Erythroxylum novogranatense]